MGHRILVNDFLLHIDNRVVIDVRSPGEFTHAHIPAAVNIPLFNDEERKVVGTIYKQQSREEAIKAGLDFFGPKMRSIVEQVEMLVKSNIKNQQSEVFIYCWRGGMRSAAIAWLLSLYGFNVATLAGGYKSFRKWALQKFSEPYSLKIIGGFTGSGKTEILQQLEKEGEQIINLEALAEHKGSAFGNIGMPKQPSQEMFDNLLALAVYKKDLQRTIWIEDESQRIGTINIPTDFWNQMRSAPISFFEIHFEERLKHICEEYGVLNKDKVAEAVHRISKRLGGLQSKKTLEFLNDGNISESFRILLQYYDKHYLKGLHNRENLSDLLTTIPCSIVSEKNAALLKNKHHVV